MLLCTASGALHAAETTGPRAFALVSAMGDRLSAVHEVPSTGSHLPPYRRRTLEVRDDGIDRLMLKSLGEAVAASNSDARATFMAVRLPAAVQDAPSRLEEAAFAFVIEQLRAMPQRTAWHRIVIATPAYRAAAHDGLGSGMEGIGVFTQPLCQGDIRSCDTRSRPATAGVAARTPSGDIEPASRYVAPFVFARISIVDPGTLAVLDTQEVFDHEKLFDPDSGAMDMNRSIDRKRLAARLVERVQASAAEALRRSELRGRVEVRERGAVPP